MNLFLYKETHFFAFIQFSSLFAQLCYLVAHPVGLSILDAKCLPDGGYPAEKKYYRVAEQMSNGCSPVDWEGTSTKHMNPFVTVEALSVCKRATVGR